MFIRLENIYSSELGKFWEMADDTAKTNLCISSCFKEHRAYSISCPQHEQHHPRFFTKAYREGQSCKETERSSFPQEIEVTGVVQRGLKSPLFHFSAPLWAFFGTFLSQQKVTTSPPQRRREQQAKSCLLFKSIMIIMEKRLLGDRGASLTFPSPSPDIPPASSRCTS